MRQRSAEDMVLGLVFKARRPVLIEEIFGVLWVAVEWVAVKVLGLANRLVVRGDLSTVVIRNSRRLRVLGMVEESCASKSFSIFLQIPRNINVFQRRTPTKRFVPKNFLLEFKHANSFLIASATSAALPQHKG